MRLYCCVLLAAVTCGAQAVKQFVGTVKSLQSETAEIRIAPDTGETIDVKVSGSTVAQRIAPGERDLKNAVTIPVADVTPGDRVLVALEPGTTDLRRIVLMPATEIARYDEADRQDWLKRGVAGVVRERKGNSILVSIRGSAAKQPLNVIAGDKTSFRRYPPDAVKFADAKRSTLKEIVVGDQIRARGEESADGSVLTAEDVVFGAFQTRVGTVVSWEPASGLLKLTETGSAKPLVVHVGPGAQIRTMPDFGGMGRGGPPPGAGLPPGGPKGGMPGGGLSGANGTRPDIGRIVEQLPEGKPEDLAAGRTVIVSSTKGLKPDEMSALTLVANADMLIRLASMGRGEASGGGRGGSQGMDAGGMSAGGMSGGGMGMSGGIDLSGIAP